MRSIFSSTCRLLLVGLLLGSSIGCQEQPVPTTLDADTARQAFTRFLDTWKQGGKPHDLQKLEPPIIVGEPDWESGSKLTKYVVLKEKEKQDGVNVHATVQLTLQPARGRKSQSEVIYIIGTSPVITIHRK